MSFLRYMFVSRCFYICISCLHLQYRYLPLSLSWSDTSSISIYISRYLPFHPIYLSLSPSFHPPFSPYMSLSPALMPLFSISIPHYIPPYISGSPHPSLIISLHHPSHLYLIISLNFTQGTKADATSHLLSRGDAPMWSVKRVVAGVTGWSMGWGRFAPMDVTRN